MPDATAIVKISDREIPAARGFSSETSFTAKPQEKISCLKNAEGHAKAAMGQANRVLPVFFHKIASGWLRPVA
jgi:hypothetical protein